MNRTFTSEPCRECAGKSNQYCVTCQPGNPLNPVLNKTKAIRAHRVDMPSFDLNGCGAVAEDLPFSYIEVCGWPVGVARLENEYAESRI
jgi:hypothetical protein